MPHHPKPWFRRSRGNWVVQIAGKQHNLGPERETAFKIYHELMSQPKVLPTTGNSVAAVMDAFLEWTKNHRAPRTYDWYLERLQSFIKTIDSNCTVDQLRPHHVQAWTDSHGTWSNGMKRGAIIAVQRSFNWAMKLGHIEKNPVGNLEKPRGGRRETVIKEPEFKQLLKLVHDEAFRDLLMAAWETGARPQELVRVEVRHIDLENARWVFPQDEAKGKRRVRVVYLTDTALEITKRLMLKHPQGTLSEIPMAWLGIRTLSIAASLASKRSWARNFVCTLFAIPSRRGCWRRGSIRSRWRRFLVMRIFRCSAASINIFRKIPNTCSNS